MTDQTVDVIFHFYGTPQMHPKEGYSVNKRKILIVDDSALNRALLTDMLEDEFEILEATNGLEATAILHTQGLELSLMLLDIVMPVMDGFELLDLMNKNGWIKTIPVVMISSESDESVVERAYDLGVLDYISRPFNERTVKRRVSSTIMLAAKQKDLSNLLASQIYEKEKDNQTMIEILSNIVEFRNGESGLHVLHVRNFTRLLLHRLLEKTGRYQLGAKDVGLISSASALHDIGKIAIPESILNKPGRFTPEEFEIMKTHSAEGAKMLQNIPLRKTDPLVQYSYQICRWHHERYDGKGYPDGLKGEEIPIAAQVVSLADVYDALTSKRVYKEAHSHEKALQMILNGECGSFNPLLLECLTDIAQVLKEELGTPVHSEASIMNTVDEVLKSNQMDTSEQLLRTLEQERMKNRFFAELSQEIRFEYRAVPEIITLSEWGAEYLHLPQTSIDPRKDAIGTQLFTPEDFARLLDNLKKTTPKDPVLEGRYLLTVNGQRRWHSVIAKTLWSSTEPPEYEGAIGKITDVHEEVVRLRELEDQASLDPLTGLLNHRTAKKYIAKLLAEDSGRHYALLFFDVDHFKQANDTYGHQFGDEVIKYVAEVIKRCTRSEDIIVRMGGDEYIIFMEYQNVLEPVVDRIFHELCCEYKGFHVNVSMGVALSKDCGGDYETLFGMADEAAYVVKQRLGRGAYHFWSPDEESAVVRLTESRPSEEEGEGDKAAKAPDPQPEQAGT